MAEFLIKVADERGRLLQQVESGISESEVRERFAQQGFLVYWVKPKGILLGGKSGHRKRVKPSTFLIFNQQLLTLLKAGLPVLGSMDLLVKRQRDIYFRALLQNVRERVKGGELLSEAFAAQHVFPKIYTTTLMAGEKSGSMDEVLARYVNFQKMALTFRKKLAVSLVYPALLVSVVVCMLIFLVTYVVPQFAKLYSDLNAQLPAITNVMLQIGTHAQRYAPVGLGVLCSDQAVPSQASARVRPGLVPLVCHAPTAVQDVADGHETAPRNVFLAAAGFAVGWIDQLLPFQRSANVVSPVISGDGLSL